MKIKKDYKIKESVLVTKNTLESLYCKYYDSYPDHIKQELTNFLKCLCQNLEKDHTYIENDILKFELIERITYNLKNNT